jgi:uncharacterized protein (DUF697 family)
MPRFDHIVVHAFALTAAGVGGGLAQLPCADAPVLVSLQTAMILALARRHDVPLDEAAATQLVLTLGATMFGRTASQALVGWLPGWGNALNATTAASLTEAIGWAAVAWFESQRPRGSGSDR